MANQDSIITAIKTGLGSITNALPTLGINPLAAIIYSLFTFGIKTGTQVYATWKQYVLSKPLSVPLIDAPPDADTIIEYLSSNPAYKDAFKDELKDFSSNDFLLKKAFIALNQMEESADLQSAFAHLKVSGNYKAFVLSYDILSRIGSGSSAYDLFRTALKQIEDNIDARTALDEMVTVITENFTSDIIDSPDFWERIKAVLA
ncbi:MAG: hypothetical protein HY999_03785 [Nitrospinae bacterium]|nr:hypothetical protein [Nitrospinota bacterium]